MSKRIFISSTCYDLIDLRAELKQFISEAGFIPVLSDHIDSGFETKENEHSIEACLTNLRQSDIIVFILSQRYGPSLEKLGYPNISATHLEYEEAIKEKKRILFFVRDKLDAEATIRKRNTGIKGEWIKEEKDYPIFDFYEQHKGRNEKDRSNWITIFSTSLDIKNKLKQELKFDLSTIRFERMLENGSLPFLNIRMGELSKAHSNITIEYYIQNETSNPGLNYEIAISTYPDDWGTETFFAERVLLTRYSFSFFNETFLRRWINTIGNNYPLRLFFEIGYVTIFGDRIVDLHEANFKNNEYTVQFVKKIHYSNDGFEKLIFKDQKELKSI